MWRRSSNEYSHLVNGERKRVDPWWIDITSMVVHSHHRIGILSCNRSMRCEDLISVPSKHTEPSQPAEPFFIAFTKSSKSTDVRLVATATFLSPMPLDPQREAKFAGETGRLILATISLAFIP